MWWRKKKRERPELPAHQDRLAQKIAGHMLYIQSAWARWMTQQSARLPIRHQKVIFILFVLLTAFILIWPFLPTKN